MNSESRYIAMLIDGDNAQSSLIEHVLAETAKYGIVTTRRIYGDWTPPQMTGWKDSLHSYAVQPVQQFRCTTGKNATDSALIIDAIWPPKMTAGRTWHLSGVIYANWIPHSTPAATVTSNCRCL